ncbi:MAG: tRNA (adenosine(37)-N6)-dimethylallyltransferase MiaA [Actinobacteria bacterium]|nr:tRNA (adenosine(37)-N6)-dimethylallyltransferase MiaA [Actinomycetota bacterium]
MLPVIVIVGPTAVGKSDLSLDLAQELDAEIINADSMQLYRGMDIGTAKVPVAERRGIVHHMLDVLDVTQTANVADYQRQARALVEQIQARSKRVVVVGGSGLFIQGLLEDLQFPSSDPEVRERLSAEAERLGAEVMYQRLVDIDPQAAQNILPTNVRRIVRALEVIELTGQAPTTTLQQLPEVIPSIRIGLRRDRADLDQRIADRVELMWNQGLVAEVQSLEKVGLREGLTASKALGYAQVLDFLNGEITEAEAKERTISSTRRYVRRQESWFNRDSRIQWLEADSESLLSQVKALVQPEPAAQ